MTEDAGQVLVRKYEMADGGATLAEYTESGSATNPSWSKSYISLGARLLSTLEPNGSGGTRASYHHPDRLGTRVVTGTDGSGNPTSFEQVTLPFGTALGNESTGATTRRFTSYDRSGTTGLDYALNRHYDPLQGRFTQVDPIEMEAVDLGDPQTLNLYSYCANDPINHVDPEGLFFKKLFKGIWKVLKSKWFGLAVAVALAVISFGATAGWWALAKEVTVSLGIDLGAGVAATASITKATALGWIHAGLTTVGAIPLLGSVQGALQNVTAFWRQSGFGQVGVPCLYLS